MSGWKRGSVSPFFFFFLLHVRVQRANCYAHSTAEFTVRIPERRGARVGRKGEPTDETFLAVPLDSIKPGLLLAMFSSIPGGGWQMESLKENSLKSINGKLLSTVN